MTRRIIINLVTFGVLFAVLSLWAVTNIISFDFITRPYTVTAEFKTSPGLQPNFEVTYLGHPIGKIGAVGLQGDHVTAKLKIERGVEVPGGVRAFVRRKSAVGEPYVELEALPDQTGFAPQLKAGDTIPLERTSTPLSYSDLFAALDQLVSAIPGDDLRTLVHELAVGVRGRADDFRTIVQSTAEATTTFAEHADLLEQVVADLTRLAHTLSVHRDALGASVDNLAALSNTLAANRANVAALVGQRFTDQVGQVLDETTDDFTCLIGALEVVVGRLNSPDHLSELTRLLQAAPRAAAALADVYVNPGEDGADGPFLDGTFLLNDGTQQLPLYNPRPELPAPPIVPSCSASHEPVTGAGALASILPGGRTVPGASAESVYVPPRVIPTPQFPETTERQLGPEGPLASILDLILGFLPLLIAVALLAFVISKRPWRYVVRAKDDAA